MHVESEEDMLVVQAVSLSVSLVFVPDFKLIYIKNQKKVYFRQNVQYVKYSASCAAGLLSRSLACGTLRRSQRRWLAPHGHGYKRFGTNAQGARLVENINSVI